MPPRRASAVAAAVGAVVSVGLTAFLLWPALGRGQLLYRDFVSVPEPVLTRATLGFGGPAPRAVPLDAVTALLSHIVSTGVQQQAMLVATLLLSGVGVAVLLRRHGWVATSTGAALATWSPYAAERLLLGQPPTLLAWSVLPWIALAARWPGPRWPWLAFVALAAAPALLTPFGVVVAVGVALTVAVLAGRRRADLAWLVTLGIAWCLPWLVPAVAGHADAGQAAGARAFAVEADGPAGVIDVLTGGGVWSSAARLASREQIVPLAASLAMLALAVLGLTGLARWRVPACAALLGPTVLALALATGPGLTAMATLQSVPGLALFRDTHRLLAPAAFALSVLVPLGLVRLVRRLGSRTLVRADPRGAAWMSLPAAAVFVGVGLAVLAAPDASTRMHAAYRPVSFPAAWDAVVREVGERPVLVLPWQPMRQVPWARAQPFLDPLPLALRGTVTAAHDLTVQRGELTFVVGSADPPESVSWALGEVRPEQLARHGITTVVDWLDSTGAHLTHPDGLRRVLTTAEFAVWVVE